MRLLNGRLKRTTTTFVRSSLTILLFAVLAPLCRAGTVTITYFGVFGSGSSDSATANVFGVGTNLTGLPFQLTITLDESNATETGSTCGDGKALNLSHVSGSSTTSGVPTIQLTAWNSSGHQGNTFTFDNYPLSSVAWELQRSADGYYLDGSLDCHGTYDTAFSISYDENYGGGTYTGESNVSSGDWSNMTSPLTTARAADWRTPVASLASPATIKSTNYLGFSISVYQSSTLIQYAHGYLYPSCTNDAEHGSCTSVLNGVYVSGFYDTPAEETVQQDSGNPWGTGANAPQAHWTQFLSATNANNTIPYSGGISSNPQIGPIRELAVSGSTTDSCSSSTITNHGSDLFPPVANAAGSSYWDVDEHDNYGDDSVGWVNGISGATYLVTYYRSMATLPCNYTGNQQMQYLWGDGSWHNYGSSNTGGPNVLEGIIDATTVSSVRAGVEATKTF